MSRQPGASVADQPPLAIAHRAGNHVRRLRKAEAIGADYVEADVRLHRGRIEVRHLKTMRYLPLLYDRSKLFGRWRLRFSFAPGWTDRLVLSALLERLAPDTGIMLDLKGDDETLTPSVLDAVRASPHGRPVIVCSQNWRHIDTLRGQPAVRAVHSVGRSDQLEALLQRPAFTTQGISIDSALLDADVIRRLRERTPMLLTWPINSRGALERVTGFGVDGVITDSFDILRMVVDARREKRDAS